MLGLLEPWLLFVLAPTIAVRVLSAHHDVTEYAAQQTMQEHSHTNFKQWQTINCY
jgi:hypothetical protein